MTQVAVLFARTDSCYKQIVGCDVWDEHRDATRWPGGGPIVAHPPCRGWGRLRHMANPRQGEKDLALMSVGWVRRWGGVLEHPAHSMLWPVAGLPTPGTRDDWDGWTLPVSQYWWGHRAEKRTWLYIVGVLPDALPPIPLRLGTAEYLCGTPGRRRDGTRLRPGDAGYRPEITKAEREHTPVAFAIWLRDVASRCVPHA